MIWLGALGTLFLFILQVVGLISVSGWLIVAPFLIGLALTILFILVMAAIS